MKVMKVKEKLSESEGNCVIKCIILILPVPRLNFVIHEQCNRWKCKR